jgi:hypothetical protein
MARTVGYVITRARTHLNDAAANPRNTTAEMERNVNAGLETMFDLRPDIFIGKFDSFPPSTPLVSADPLPVTDRWVEHLVDYVIFRCEMRDDEHVLQERAVTAAQWFAKRLAG